MQRRQITIQPKHQARVGRDRITPSISISGIWLEEAGFNIGQKVQIEVLNNQIIFKVEQ